MTTTRLSPKAPPRQWVGTYVVNLEQSRLFSGCCCPSDHLLGQGLSPTSCTYPQGRYQKVWNPMPRADACVCLLESVNSLLVALTCPGQVSDLQLSALLFPVPKWQQFSPVARSSSATQPGAAILGHTRQPSQGRWRAVFRTLKLL